MNKKNIKVDISVIIPLFNAENYLSKCIESVLKQRNINFEVIIIDDGSTDKSSVIADFYAKDNSRIYVIHKENGGVSTARNVGLEKVTGDYIFFLDADDSINEGTLSNMLESARKHKIDVVECKYVFSSKSGIKDEKPIELFPSKNKIDFFYKGNVGYCAGKLMRRKIIEDNSIRFNENMHYGEDKNFVLQVLSFADICCIDNASVYYVGGDNSLSLSKKYVKNFSYCSSQILESTLKFFNSCAMSKERVLQLHKQVKVTSLQSFLGNLYRMDSMLKRNDRIKIIKEYIIENKDIIDTIDIEKNDSMNLYSIILNSVIKTKEVNLIDFVCWIKSIAVRLLPRKH